MSIVSSACWIAAPASALTVGKPATDFSTSDIEGKNVRLSEFKGKIVVVEWNNPECPFVKKFYGSHAMQDLQKDAAKKDVVWLTINSSGSGKQGNMDTAKARNYIKEAGAMPAHYILDPKGDIGKAFDAKTTPHMFIIGKDGNIAYMGAIDDTPSTDPSDIVEAKNYVRAALDDLTSGKSIQITSTEAYGCSVKYSEAQ